MITRQQIEGILGRVRPFLQADGGDIELISVEGNSAAVRLKGQCAGCPSAHMTLYIGIEKPRFAKNSLGSRASISLEVPIMSGPATFQSNSVVVGSSDRIRGVFEFLRVISGSESTVLITGESGTGKEVVATLIHQSSRRKHQPFVAVSCALFSETLIESELFGHERGSFTGAIKDHPGRFELANGGTLFLDDLDDVPLSMQVKLIRVLQNHTVERVGGTRAIPVNVRVLAGSKRDLKQLVAEEKFREDLYYRLNVLPVVLPPLRERPEDIPALVEHFLERYFRRRGQPVPTISEGVKLAFARYSWPGNVRELENACERIAQTCTCGKVGVGCVAANILLRAGAGSTSVRSRRRRLTRRRRFHSTIGFGRSRES